MRMALISEANTPGPLRNVVNQNGWQINGVEALAWACGGDVWHGASVDDLAATALKAYDVVVVNLKHTLWDAVPDIRRAAAGVVIGYHEGPTDLFLRLDAEESARFLSALHHCHGYLIYEAEMVSWAEQYSGLPTAWCPLPAAMDVYALHSLSIDLRAPIMVAHTPDERRGAVAAMTALACLPDRRPVLYVRSMSDVCYVSGSCVAAPHYQGWAGWCRSPGQPLSPLRLRWSWLDALARCSGMLNLDPSRCYGRYVVDCAGLGVPCYGIRGNVMQDVLWGGYTNPCDAIRALEKDVAISSVEAAGKKLATYTPDLCRTAIKEMAERFRGREI